MADRKLFGYDARATLDLQVAGKPLTVELQRDDDHYEGGRLYFSVPVERVFDGIAWCLSTTESSPA